MNITLNGEAAAVEATRLDRALAELGYAGAHVATALNGEFVPRGRHAETEVRPGDRLEVLAPLPGG